MEQVIYNRRESDGITSKPGEHLGEASAVHSCGVATENLADVSIITSRRTSQRAVLKSAAAPGTTAMLGTSLLEPSSPAPGSQLSRKPRLTVVPDPRAVHRLERHVL